MGYVLLWIESLAVSLLFVATLAACLAQLGPRQSRWFARGSALLIVSLAVTGLAAGWGAGVERPGGVAVGPGGSRLRRRRSLGLAKGAMAWGRRPY